MLSVAAAVMVVLCAGIRAQDLVRTVPAKSSIQLDPAIHRADLLVIKFVEGSGVGLLNGVFVSESKEDLHALHKLIRAHAAKPFFAGLEGQLKNLRQRVLQATPAGSSPPADLSLYFTLATTGAVDSRRLLLALNELKVVELAYPKELPTPPPGCASESSGSLAPGDIFPVTPSFTAQQTYHNAAPDGVDALAMRSLVGGWGEGITVLDIEWGWDFDHEDLARLRPSSLVGPAIANPAFNAHGVAVMGELSADPDQYGVTGLVPDVRLLCVTDFPATGYSVARAIVVGLPKLQAGDVMLLEAQTGTPRGLGPTEYNQADFDAIQNATRLGVVTVEAAGNGSANLDDPVYQGLFDLRVRDSGAIIVGATEGKSLIRASFSSYGSRIDANGWGRNVVSTGYGTLWISGRDRRQAYTNSFSGTSSASPMVTAAVVTLLGAARRQRTAAGAKAMGYLEIRRLLRKFGTPLPNQSQPIGMRPDMASILAAADLDRGLRVLGDAVLGKSVQIRFEADPSVGSGDFWGLIAAYDTALQPIPAPFVGPGCGLLLLDLANSAVHASGLFRSGNIHTETVAVPAVPALLHKRLYWQAITLQTSGSACLSNSAMIYVQN